MDIKQKSIYKILIENPSMKKYKTCKSRFANLTRYARVSIYKVTCIALFISFKHL